MMYSKICLLSHNISCKITLRFIALLCMFLSWNAWAQTTGSPSYNPPSTIEQLMNMVEHEEILLIDVRTPAEFEKGHLQGAISIEYQHITQEIAHFTSNKKTPIALYCRSGQRSGIAASELLSQGFENILDLGGYGALKQAGYPSQKP